MMLEIPRIIGHRGAAGLVPENTIPSFERAAAIGCRMVEFDAKLTQDNKTIVIHDETLDRTTSGRGEVKDTPLDRIRALDAGSWFGPGFAGLQVPTLEEVLAAAVRLGLAVNIEIKPCPDRERETASAVVVDALHRWPAHRPPPLISSFAPMSLLVARDIAPDWPRGYLIDEAPPDWAAIADAVDAETINVNQKRETAETIAAYRATGRPVLAYTVNDRARAEALFAAGIAAVFTDRPDLLIDLDR